MSISEHFITLREGGVIFYIASDYQRSLLIVHSEQHARLALLFQFNENETTFCHLHRHRNSTSI